MTLREKQSKFTKMVGELILFAYENGYELTLGNAYRSSRDPTGSRKSLHRKRLAIDINLFIEGKYQRTTRAHEPLGEFWKSIGGTWGGDFGDGNHYSLEHRGKK
jgi:hypothetical protein